MPAGSGSSLCPHFYSSGPGKQPASSAPALACTPALCLPLNIEKHSAFLYFSCYFTHLQTALEISPDDYHMDASTQRQTNLIAYFYPFQEFKTNDNES